MFVQGLLLFVKIIINNYILYCLSILILRDQSNATVDVCATVLSKSQNAFFSLSSLIKERKETTRCARLLFWDVDRVWIIMYMYLVSMP